MVPLVAQLMVEFGALKGRCVLWIRWLALPLEGGELLAPSPADRVDKLWVEMADKKLKRCSFAIFLPHEQER